MRVFVKQFLRFAAVGLIAFAVDYALFLLLHLLGMPYLIANIISYSVSTVCNFVLSMRYVFAGKAGQTRSQQFVIFVVLSVIGLGLNELFLWLLVEFAGIWAGISKFIAAALVTVFNFTSRKMCLEDRKQ